MKLLTPPLAIWQRAGLCLSVWAALISACSGTQQASSPMNLAPTLTNVSTSTPSTPPSPTNAPTATPSSIPAKTLSLSGAATVGLTMLPEEPTATPAALVYIFPVQPPNIASFKQGHHDYPATDILAPVGSQFVAVTQGVVDFVSDADLWDPSTDDPALRGGLSVAIIGDDGVRYYGSHLSAIAPDIAPGMRVEAGQLLGYVGNSGNARHTASHLHFGISRPTYPEDWAVRRGEIDPYPYLKAWAAGK